MISMSKRLIEVLTQKAEEADRWECDGDRYDEGYADAMFTAIDIVKEMLKDE